MTPHRTTSRLPRCNTFARSRACESRQWRIRAHSTKLCARSRLRPRTSWNTFRCARRVDLLAVRTGTRVARAAVADPHGLDVAELPDPMTRQFATVAGVLH